MGIRGVVSVRASPPPPLERAPEDSEPPILNLMCQRNRKREKHTALAPHGRLLGLRLVFLQTSFMRLSFDHIVCSRSSSAFEREVSSRQGCLRGPKQPRQGRRKVEVLI
jgi:hypothetical protein